MSTDSDIEVKFAADLGDLQDGLSTAASATGSALTSMQEIAAQVSATISGQLTDALKEITSQMQRTTEAAHSTTEGIGELGDVANRLGQVTGAAVIYEGFRKVGEVIEEITGRAVEFRNMSETLDISTDAAQALSAAADEAGVSFGQLERAGVKLSETLHAAQTGSADARAALMSLGLTLDESRDPATTLMSVLERIHDRLNDAGTASTEMAALVSQLGARAAIVSEALKGFDGSAEGVNEVMKRLNGTSAEQNKQLVDMHGQWESLTTAISNASAHALLWSEHAAFMFANWQEKVGKSIDDFLGVEHKVSEAFAAWQAQEAKNNGSAGDGGQQAKVAAAAAAAAEQQRLAGQVSAADIAAVERSLAAYREGSAERLAITKQLYELTAALYGSDSDKALEAAAKVTEAQRAYAEKSAEFAKQAAEKREHEDERLNEKLTRQAGEQIDQEIAKNAKILAADHKLREAQAKGAEELALAQIDASTTAANAELKSKQLTPDQYLASEQALIAAKLAAEKAYYEQLKTIRAADAADVVTAAADEAKAAVTAITEMQAANTRATEAIDAQWKTIDRSITSALDSAFNSMLHGTTSFTQSVRNLFVKLGEDLIEGVFTKLVTAWVQGEAKKLATSQMAQNILNTLHLQSLVTSKASNVAEATSTITTDAATAAAGAFSATAAIPYIGPELAPAAAASAEASVLSFMGQIASAAGGWAQIPKDQMALVHRNEMVLPANLAEGIRSRLSGGSDAGGGDTHHYHMGASMDSKSFGKWINSHANRNELAKAMRRSLNSGNRVAVR